MKIKIIDLLNMISKEEEVPKKIKYKNKIYEWKEYDVCYGKIMTKKGWVKELGYVAEENKTYFYLKHCYQDLNDEVEILEDDKLEFIMNLGNNKVYYDKETKGTVILPNEEKKIPEKLEILTFSDLIDMPKEKLIDVIKEQRFKINSIIDYLKSKGDE